ncbi:type VI secretion protein IcmF/TssM N-terminal domain-containing protein [Desulfobulbus sp.]|uniref:type VI secretion protein IcmF/TssM N-terminal domain-containing protein n=1 Tax=Desulfobulbus sp. TaxID=895 RepID=UPI0027B99460|nr:type VI secretion protein IcmF/TssM N-terminal domain-containing protein [Desulfobulbus sp.]
MKLLLKIFKFLFIFLVVVGVLFSAFWMTYVKEWPLWSGASLILLALGLVLGWYGLKKLLVRHREKQFVKQVVAQDTSLADVADSGSAEHLLSLERQWAESLSFLKASHLAKKGDPLYALPWYMMLGARGSGKTAALRSARLSSPFPEAMRPGESGTRFCDWWFTDNAIILDTAGKYATPSIDVADHDEWQRLLTLLLAARRKEPLNGVVVTIAADQLLDADKDALMEEGRALRLRVDELMRVLGAKFPVYVLVTKCDQIYGMGQMAKNLPESFFKQPMGVVNDDFTRPVNDVIRLTLDTLCERLREMRFTLLNKAPGDKTGLLLLSEEIRNVQSGLEHFMQGLFRANPYQESPIARGIFFSSAQQSGTSISHYIQSMQYADDASLQEKDPPLTPAVDAASTGVLLTEVLPGTKRSLFLYDFFDGVLAADRWMHTPLRAAVRNFRINWGIGMIAWLAILGGGFGLASTSYMLNRHVINEYVAEFKEPTYLTGSMLEDILILDRFRTIILKMEESNKHWWVPRFGLNQSEVAVARLKKNYCTMFSDNFYDKTVVKKLDENIAKITPQTPGRERGSYVANIVSRLQFVNARLEKKNLEYMKKLPEPSGAFLVLLDSRITPEIARQYQDIYLYYSAWQDDLTPAAINKQKLSLQLSKILTGEGGQYDLGWVLEWIDSTEVDQRITLRSFWEGSEDLEDIFIEPCFTVAGKEKLDDFIAQIYSVASHSATLDEQIKLFNDDYKNQYITVWENFAKDFPQGKATFSSTQEMHAQAAAIGINKIPSELFIERMVKELEPFSKGNTLPPWLKLAIEHERIRARAHEDDFNKQTAGFSKAANDVMEGSKTLLKELSMKKIELPNKDKTLSFLDAVNAYVEFRKSIQDMAKGITTNAATTRLAADIFSSAGSASAAAMPPNGEAGGLASSQYAKAQETFKSFQAQMRHIGDDNIYWDIINSSLDFITMIAAKEAACSLQEQWESQVLAETSAVGESSLQELLFGAQGIVWQYVKGPAAPFVKGGPQGYQPTSVRGQRIAFNPRFIDFLNQGNLGRDDTKENYTVKIKAYPIHVNQEATQKPQSVVLTLACGDELQSLNNMNYSVQKFFKWNFKNCDETVLNIKFGALTLERKYSGGLSFINFLSDFQNGERNFSPDDFPKHESDLRAMNVRQIRIHYLFEGHDELLNLPENDPVAVPPNIATCQH